MTDPVTGELTTFRADTVKELERLIAAWKARTHLGRIPEPHLGKGV